MMNTTKSILTFFALLLTFSGFAQLTSNPDIQKKLDQFIDLTNEKKYDQAFDIMYPKMFSQVGKQELVDMMTAMDNDGLSLTVTNRRITAFSTPFVDKNETFVRIDYTADMNMKIKPGGLYDSPKASTAMQQQFESVYGANNVKYDATSKNYTIMAQKAMMAIREEGKDWHLVEINTDQMELMRSLFSEAVINALVVVK